MLVACISLRRHEPVHESCSSMKPTLIFYRAASIAWLEGVAPAAQLATPELRAPVLAAYVAGRHPRLPRSQHTKSTQEQSVSCCVIGLRPGPLRVQLATPELRANVLAAYAAGGHPRLP